ncbi:scavenger receptor cysteine-rich domain-containing protein DMBT1-like [Haliotis cracherodii]|uniref:scavenger receptor cysteine-rich domain-containing protein DMBT1-like n=1 Tax=Haliotis cracherodii TaxID=6455 RepID=UPI0039E88C4B
MWTPALTACLVLLCPVYMIDIADSDTLFARADSTPLLLTKADPRVQVFRNGQWGFICGHGWNSRDAKVICRMQGYWHGTGTARIIPLIGGETFWLDDVDCIGNETDITDCQFQGWGIPSCPAGGVAGVNCEVSAQPNVRLTDGFGPWEGRVEIYENNMWQPVCTAGWDDKDAQVICRELGIRSKGGLAHNDAKYGRSPNPPIITSTVCVGTESDISLCPATRVLPSQTSCDQAGVECYNCGNQYSSETGTLQSDNYPQPYPRNVHCLYIIRPTNTGQLYKLEFTDFKTESCCDIVHVSTLNSSSSNPVGGSTYSGNSKPPILLGKAFVVSFDTDGSNSMAGFQAKWSPALVQDVVNMSCDAGTFNIQIDLPFLKRLYPASSERTIALADPSCTGTIINDIIVINTNANSCGTIVKTETGRHVYTNFLVDRIFATESNNIVRGERWKIPIACSVPRSKSFSIHYHPYPDVGTRRESEVERMSREVKGHIRLQQYFPMSITVYEDQAMTIRQFTRPQKRLGEDLFFRVQLDQADSDLKLVVTSCFALPTAVETRNSSKYILAQGGCTVDSGTHVLRTTNHYTDFQMKVFKFAGNYDQVYITCDVRVCPVQDSSASCQQTCQSPGKRSTSRQEGRNRVRFGPVIIEDSPVN